jgi:hypothetical protein
VLEVGEITLKTISLYQPWASAIAVGAKLHETRCWGTKYRGPLAIHASVRRWGVFREQFYEFLEHPVIEGFFENGLELDYNALPYGAIVCVCDLVECVPTEAVLVTEWDRMLGDYSPGRFAWRLENVRRLTRVHPARGRQMFFDVPGELGADGFWVEPSMEMAVVK